MLTATTVVLFLLLVVACRLFALHHYRWWFRQGFVGDASVHFSIIRQLRKNRRSQYIEQYLISPEPMVYPTYFHHFARRFPLGTIKAHPYLPSLVLSLLFSCIFIILAAYIDENLFPGNHGLLPVSALLILCSPTFHCFGGNSITYISLSERTLARLATGLSYMLCCVFLLTGDIISLAFGISFGALACLSSIFARQVLLFTMPVLAGLLTDWRPLAILLAILIMALAAGGKHFARGLQHTFLHWMCYIRFTKKGRITRIGLSEFKAWSFRDHLISWRTITENLLTKEPTRTLLNNIELPAAICMLTVSSGRTTGEWAAFLAAPIFVYIVTSTAWLSFLGEGYRYIEYALVFLAPLAAAVHVATAPPPALTVWAALMSFALIGIGVTWYTRRFIEHRQSLESVSDRLSTFLSSANLPDDAVVFPVTMRLGADITARKAGWKSFWWQPGLQLPSIFEEYIEEYPFLKRNWWPIFKKHRVTHVICQKNALAYIDWKYPFEKLKLIFEDKYYAIYSAPLTNYLNDSTKMRRITIVQIGTTGAFPATSQLIAACIRLFPGAYITTVCSLEAHGLHQRCPYIKEVFLLKDTIGLREALQFVRQQQPDMVLNCSWPSLQSADLICLGAHAPFTAAIMPTTDFAEAYSFAVSCPQATPPHERIPHILEYFSADYSQFLSKTWLTSEDFQLVHNSLESLYINAADSILLLASRNAPMEICAQVARGMNILLKDKNAPNIVTAGSAQHCSLFMKLYNGSCHTLSNFEDCALWPGLMSAFRFTIVLDWETSWLATASKARHLVIPGSAFPISWMPESPFCTALLLPLECQECGGECRYDHPYCILAIPKDIIAQAIGQTYDQDNVNGPYLFTISETDFCHDQEMPAWQALQNIRTTIQIRKINSTSLD